MAYQAVFKRSEIKYMLTEAQKQRVLAAIAPYMALDRYGRTTIRNVYFDTGNYRLIRHSIEKPAYKEKLRLRSYDRATPEKPVFVELKKKYDSTVYKRRLTMPEQQAVDWICNGNPAGCDSQIAREIDYFAAYYKDLRPAVFLSYEREAYFCHDGSDLRITFDDTILARRSDLSLQAPIGGSPLLEQGKVLMEVKTSGGMPLWLTKMLTQERIYKTSFSKYGVAYETMIFPDYKGGFLYA